MEGVCEATVDMIQVGVRSMVRVYFMGRGI